MLPVGHHHPQLGLQLLLLPLPALPGLLLHRLDALEHVRLLRRPAEVGVGLGIFLPPLVLRSLGMLGDRRESLGDAEGGGAELALGPRAVY